MHYYLPFWNKCYNNQGSDMIENSGERRALTFSKFVGRL